MSLTIIGSHAAAFAAGWWSCWFLARWINRRRYRSIGVDREYTAAIDALLDSSPSILDRAAERPHGS